MFAILFVYIWRKLYGRFLGLKFFQNVLIVGTNPLGTTILKEFKSHPLSGYNITGFASKEKEKVGSQIEGIEVLGTFENIREVVKKHRIEQVVIAALPQNRTDSLFRELISCMQAGVEVEDMHVLYERITGRIPYRYVEESWFLYSKIGENTLYKRLLKQLLGKLIAGIVLLVSAPVFLLIMMVQKIFYKGPVFYTQERQGKLGKKFKIVKFRTMVQNAEEDTGPVWAGANDSRVTGFGRFLRRTRLDELPQMFNILKGDMSFIGPRPEREHFVKQFQEKIPFYSYRLSVSPGLTGWAQIKYDYDTTIDDVYKKLEYDFYYIKNMSFFLDAAIFLHTIRVIFLARGH